MRWLLSCGINFLPDARGIDIGIETKFNKNIKIVNDLSDNFDSLRRNSFFFENRMTPMGAYSRVWAQSRSYGTIIHRPNPGT